MALAARLPMRPAVLACIVVAFLLPFGLDSAQLTTCVFIVISAIGAVGLNVLTGYTGQISLGHAFFLAIGAYTAAVLGGDHHVSALIWIPAAGLAAAACGLLVGPTALRLRGLYLAIVTLGLLFIGQHLFFNLDGITGGPQGRAFPAVQFGSFDFSPGQQLTIGGATIDHDGLYYYLGLIILLASLLFVRNLVHSRPGRAMQAVRERELAGSVLGVDVAGTKLMAFGISSFFAGVSGALFVSYLSFAQPAQWDLLLSIQYLAAITVGGIGTLYGPVLGSVVVFAIPDLAKSLPFISDDGTGLSPGNFSSILYGVLIIIFFVVEPRGVAGLGPRLSAWLRRPGAATTPMGRVAVQSIDQEEAGSR